MLRLLLVDDDFLARNAVHQLLNLPQCPPCELIEARDGREAIDLLQAGLVPDLTLIDVSMPGMDGLTLLDWVHTHRPQLRCAMLSSYSDFEYVREALKNGAFDYLLKHQLTLDSLLALFGPLGDDASPVQTPAYSLARALEAFLSLDGAPAPDWDTPLGVVLYVGVLPMTGSHDDTHIHSILQTCRHTLSGTPVIACLPQLPLLAFVAPGGPEARRLADAQQHLLNETVMRYHNARISWQPPLECPSLDAVRGQYLSALGTHIDTFTASKGPTAALTFESALTTAVLHNHQETIRQLIDERFAEAASTSNPRAPESELAVLLQKYSAHLLHIEAIALPSTPSAEQARQHLVDSFCALAAQHQQLSYTGYSENIRKTLTFLHEHMTEEVRLSDVAAHCNINYSYLSYLFKKETGTGIIQYLNSLRIQQCMRLILLQNIPVTQVYEKTGFKNHSHFYAVFKSITGIPPAQFKRSPDAIHYMMHFSPLKSVEFSPK